MIIGIFRFYRQLLPLYDPYIRPWRYISSKNLQPGKLSKKRYIELMHNLWTPEYQRLLEIVNEYIIAGTKLERPDPYWRSYIKTD